MSKFDHKFSFAARFWIYASSVACVSLLLGGGAAHAGGSTVLGFAQVNPDDVIVATDNGSGTTTLSTSDAINTDGGGLSVPVAITNFLGNAGVDILAYETLVGVTSEGTASTFHSIVFQNFSGTVEFTSGINGTGANYLTAAFAPVSLSGSTGVGGGSGATSGFLTGGAPPDTLTLTSDFAIFSNPTGMNISFSNITPALSIASDSSIASFTAQNAGTFSASFAPVPEPATLSMASIALAVGTIAFLRKRSKVAA